jgi:hypothetical protein
MALKSLFYQPEIHANHANLITSDHQTRQLAAKQRALLRRMLRSSLDQQWPAAALDCAL